MILLGIIDTFLKFTLFFKFLEEMWRIFRPLLNISLHWLWFRLTYSVFIVLGIIRVKDFKMNWDKLPKLN
jgi:hypothetical protein